MPYLCGYVNPNEPNLTQKMKKIVVLTGAGMSVESGLRTFRGADGMWEDEPVERIATHEGWLREPDFVNAFYNKLRRKYAGVKPNKGHRLVASLQDHYEVTVVTQNVDDLHEQAGSRRVIHLHGELMKGCSSRDVDDPRYHRVLTPDHPDITPGEKAGDGSLMRPFIVFFGEAVPMIEAAAEAVSQADILIIIGTSLVVYPAAGLMHYAPKGCPVYLIDPADVGIHGMNVTHIKKGASEGMRQLMTVLV